MTERIVRFASPTLDLTAGDAVEPSSHTLGEWTIREEYERVSTRLFSATSGPYRIIFETRVPEDEDADIAYLTGCSVAYALDRAFSYATGLPFRGRTHQYYLRPTAPPPGWQIGGGADLISPAGRSMISDGRSFDSHRRTTEGLPLTATVRALRAIMDADDVTARLCEIHYGALTATEPDLSPLLYAQGLELVSPLLAGTTKAARQSGLPQFVSERMPRPLDWYFLVSNRRLETRHSLESRSTPSLFPTFSEEELSHFFRGADILLRYVACARLSIPLVACDDGVSVAAG